MNKYHVICDSSNNPPESVSKGFLVLDFSLDKLILKNTRYDIDPKDVQDQIEKKIKYYESLREDLIKRATESLLR